MRTSGKTNNTPGWPNLHKTGPGTEKHIKKKSQSSFLSLSPARWGALLFPSLDQRALTPRRWIFFSYHLNKIEVEHWSLILIYLRAITLVCPRPKSCDPQRDFQCPSLQLFVVTRQRTEEHILALQNENKNAYAKTCTCMSMPVSIIIAKNKNNPNVIKREWISKCWCIHGGIEKFNGKKKRTIDTYNNMDWILKQWCHLKSKHHPNVYTT